MLELIPEKFDIVLPLIEDVEFDTVFAHAVIEKRQPGKIFVDDATVPSAALITHHFGMALLCGDYNNRNFIENVISILLKKGEYQHSNFRLTVHPNRFEEKFNDMLGDRLVRYSELEAEDPSDAVKKLNLLSHDHAVGWQRIKMKFNENTFKNGEGSQKLPQGLTLKKIDKELFDGINGTIVPKVFWDSYDNFSKNGIGYCLLKDDSIVSTSFSAYISSKEIDIGIETSQDFRGKGLAVLPCAAMVKYCLENGYEPIWGCRKDNQSSSRLAKKLGFEEKLIHTIYWPVNL